MTQQRSVPLKAFHYALTSIKHTWHYYMTGPQAKQVRYFSFFSKFWGSARGIGADRALGLRPGQPSQAWHLPPGWNHRRRSVKKVSPQERTQEDSSLPLLGNLRADVIIPYILMSETLSE